MLSSALELQSRAIVPGSIRLVFAIIYSLFLGYGITVGTAIYGAIDSNATNKTYCDNPLNPYWNFLFVPLYVFFTTFTVQAKYKQMPVMILIATAGYTVNFFSNMKFSSSAPIAYTFGAFTIGVLANLYSRLRHGVAAAVLLPAVYVQVPGSLASSGSINSALKTASALIKGNAVAGDVSLFMTCFNFRLTQAGHHRQSQCYRLQRRSFHDTDCHWYYRWSVHGCTPNLSLGQATQWSMDLVEYSPFFCIVQHSDTALR